MQKKSRTSHSNKLRLGKKTIATLALNAQQARLLGGGLGYPWDIKTTTSAKYCTSQNNTQTDDTVNGGF
jgi:hypothetical protein